MRPHSPGISNIQNITVPIQENRSFDTLIGGLTYNPNIDGLINVKYYNPTNVSQPDSQNICAAEIAQNIALDDPDYTITSGNIQVFGTYHPAVDAKSSMNGFVTEQSYMYSLQNNMMEIAEVINYYKPELIAATSAMVGII